MSEQAQTISHVIFTDKYFNTCECGIARKLDCYIQNEDEVWLSFCDDCKTLFIARENRFTKPTLLERFKQLWQ